PAQSIPQEKKKPNNLFAALARNNESTSSRKSNKTATKPPRTRVTLRKGKVGRKSKAGRKSKTGLPGVRLKNLFGIDSNETEEFDEPVLVASAPNLARKGRHGLLIQRPDVKVGCFPRKLVRILKKVGRRFGKTAIVTSGYRSRSYNIRVGGARKSTHVRCLAADIQIRGVSKWAVAKYLRSIHGRGGVGTYCHTKSVHIDIGTKRAWHHCKRRRRGRRRKS
ncbi:MAG: D-Ala-D-Ala carboxypeptidase family metallohydrolase, partial [Rhizobiaceae bacterium]